MDATPVIVRCVTMTLPILALLLSPLVGELQLEADTLELSQRAIAANEITLQSGALQVSAKRLKSAAMEGCNHQGLRLDNAVLTWHQEGILEAQTVQFCRSSQALQLDSIRGRYRQVTMHARTAVGHIGTRSLTLRDGHFSTCGCENRHGPLPSAKRARMWMGRG